MNAIERRIKKLFFRSSDYWEKRYKKGGNSGAGSYDEMAQDKADFINGFIRERGIKRLLDFGCGDGNQAGYITVEEYLGVDVSQTAVAMCREKHRGRPNYRFQVYDAQTFREETERFGAELAISMDVIFHLVEEEVFGRYIRELFASATRYVVIYSTNFDREYEKPHQVDRAFTQYISARVAEWELVEMVENPHKDKGTLCDYFIYARKG